MKKLTYMLLLLLCPLFCIPSWAADKKAEKKPKEVKLATLFKNASTAIKNKGGQDAARDQLLAALAREDLRNRDRANIYYTAALLEQSLHRNENTKAYLKQKYDSAVFFSKVRDMYNQLRLCDSLDHVPGPNGKMHPRYCRKTHALRHKYRRNLLNGGKFFLTKKDYKTSYTFFDLYCSNECDEENDPDYPQAVRWAAMCGFMVESPEKTLRYIDKAIGYSDQQTAAILWEYKVRSYEKLNNDSLQYQALVDGIQKYPTHDYFFVHLLDWYYVKRQFEEAQKLSDQLIQQNPTKAIYYYAKSKISLAENDYEHCIEYSDSTIHRQADFVDAYYNKGIAYLNLAIIQQEASCSDMTDPKCVADREKTLFLYEKARPCMEKVRELQPDQQERWASPLYRIYLNLNQGDQFDELDRLLHK